MELALHSPSHLWSAARDAFDRLRTRFDSPHDIAAWLVLKRSERIDLGAWLRGLEALVRRIVLIEALAQPAAPVLGKASPQSSTRRVGAGRASVSLRLWPRLNPHPARIRMLGPATSVREIWADRRRAALAQRLARARRHRRCDRAERIARRIEALRRILDRPQAAIRRLARKLSATPQLRLTLAVARMPRSEEVDVLAQNAAARIAFAAVAQADSS
jgi:hypothetical protein